MSTLCYFYARHGNVAVAAGLLFHEVTPLTPLARAIKLAPTKLP